MQSNTNKSINNRKMYFNDDMQTVLNVRIAHEGERGSELLKNGKIYIGYSNKDQNSANQLTSKVALKIDDKGQFFVDANDDVLKAKYGALVIDTHVSSIKFAPSSCLKENHVANKDKTNFNNINYDNNLNNINNTKFIPNKFQMNNTDNFINENTNIIINNRLNLGNNKDISNNVNNMNNINNINNMNQSMHNDHQNSQANNINFGNNNIFNQDDSEDEELRAVLEKSRLEYEAEKTAMEKYKDDYLNDNGEAMTEKGQEAIDKAKDEDLPFGYYFSGDHRHIKYQTKIYKPGKGGGKGSGE